MAILKILQYPDPRLHKIAQPVTKITPAIRQLVHDMAETMYAAPGVGLAATQVDVHQQILVADISEEHNQLIVLINPTIHRRDGNVEGEEGCLSVPGVYEKVQRAEKISVSALNLQGQAVKLELDGFLAVCIQHEVDHLHGKVFVEHLSPLKQGRIRTKLQKRQRERM